MKRLLLVLLILVTGCSYSTFAKVMLPVNAAAAYFTTIGMHEFSHAAAADVAGAEDIEISFLPSIDNNQLSFARTTAYGTNFSSSEDEWFRCAPSAGEFVQSVTCRAFVKSGMSPQYLQPTFAWIDLGARASSYYHCIAGLSGIDGSDMADSDKWIPATILAVNILYDIISFVVDDELIKYLKVLIGEDHYVYED